MLKKILQDKDVRLMAIGAPILYTILFSLTYINCPNYKSPVTLIDNDNSQISRQLTRKLNSSNKLLINKSVEQTQDTEIKVKSNDRDSLIVIPENFQKNVKKQTDTHISVLGNANNFFQTNRVLNTASDIIAEQSDEVFKDNLQKKGISKTKAAFLAKPISNNTQEYWNIDFDYSKFIIPGIIILIAQQVSLISLCFVFIGKFNIKQNVIAVNLLNIVYCILSFYIYIRFFDIYVKGNFIYLLIMIISMCAAITLMARAASLFLKTKANVLLVFMFLSTPAFLISGYSWPKESVPLLHYLVSIFIPSNLLLSPVRQISLGNLNFNVFIITILSTFSLGIFYHSLYFCFSKRLK